eukprot:COSAG06_NODE_61050_length_269_cov_0.576471_2_plen_37_part_01
MTRQGGQAGLPLPARYHTYGCTGSTAVGALAWAATAQ